MNGESKNGTTVKRESSDTPHPQHTGKKKRRYSFYFLFLLRFEDFVGGSDVQAWSWCWWMSEENEDVGDICRCFKALVGVCVGGGRENFEVGGSVQIYIFFVYLIFVFINTFDIFTLSLIMRSHFVKLITYGNEKQRLTLNTVPCSCVNNRPRIFQKPANNPISFNILLPLFTILLIFLHSFPFLYDQITFFLTYSHPPPFSLPIRQITIQGNYLFMYIFSHPTQFPFPLLISYSHLRKGIV